MVHKQIVFPLVADSEGYPPVSSEGLWAIELPNGNMRIDSIPFYVRGISKDDEVQFERDQHGELWYRGLVRPSKNSTFRLFVSSVEALQEIRSDLNALGAESEANETAGLIAVGVLGHTPIGPVLAYMMDGKVQGRFDFEEAALRHNI